MSLTAANLLKFSNGYMGMAEENIEMLIKRLNRLDVDSADYNFIVSIFRKAIEGARIRLSHRAFQLYFRARICNDAKPLKINELKAPPTEFVKGFQRCNPPGMPMFYSSSKRITALLECNVKAGDKVYLGQWLSRKPAPVIMIMSSEMDPELTELTQRESSLYAYIDTVFTRPIHETFSNAYKITSAVTEVLTTGYQEIKDFYIGEDYTVGILYPSVANIEDSYNCAFHANFASNRLELLHVMELVVKSRDGKKIAVEITDNAIEFLDGNIEWLNAPHAVPKLRDRFDVLLIISNGKSWVIPIRDTMPTPEEVDELLNENANGKSHILNIDL
jgi:hypothetical protein